MICYLNGKLTPVEEAVVSVMDRGFLYGDGLFETVAVHQSRTFRWDAHCRRLERGASYLGIPLPSTPSQLRHAAMKVIEENALSHGVLRLTLTRGIGPRGYSPRGAGPPTLVITAHPGPALDGAPMRHWSAVTSTVRLPAGEKLNSFKHTSKLAQIMARAEADLAGTNEAILLNTNDELAEGSSTNLFWIEDSGICTPPIDSGILAGITREVIIEVSRDLGMHFQERSSPREALFEARGAFVASSGIGIAGLEALDGRPLPTDTILSRIYSAFCHTVLTGLDGRNC